MPNIREEWNHIRRKSNSEDKFDRVASLAFAVASLEVALVASGVDKQHNEGILRRLIRGGLLTDTNLPSEDTIKTAIEARNLAVHQTVIPEKSECQTYVNTLYTIWSSLRRRFVNQENAATIAAELYESHNVLDVYMYGSLARGKPDPNDMDLLVFDDGEVSYLSSEYGLFAGLSIVEAILELAGILNEKNRAAINSGWFDCIVINGNLFGNNIEYTRSVARIQPDPLFLLNISEGLLEYDYSQNLWVKEKSPSPKGNTRPFDKLASLREELKKIGVVTSQD